MSERDEGWRPSRLVDPSICPDCRATLDAAGTCIRCGLRLTGPLAEQLWQQMQGADRLIRQLRSAATVPPAGRPAPSPAPAPAPVARSTPRLLPSASVPIVLLSLGALCLLVAAIVFVAVAWGSLGLGAKTTILLVVTAGFAAAAAAVTRRSLRFAAETLWLVVAGLVAVDVAAAYGADLLGLARIGDRSAVALVGATLLGLAVGVGAWATATPLRRVHGLVVVAALGTALLAGAEAWTSEHNPGAVALSVPVIAAVALALDRVSAGHLRPTAWVLAGASGVSWVVLVGRGVDRLVTTETDGLWWSHLEGWPLLAAAAFAAAPALLAGVPVSVPLPQGARSVAAGAALVTGALFLAGPSTDPTTDLLTWAVLTALVAAVAATAFRTWALPAAALTLVALVVWAGLALVRPLDVVTRLPLTASPRDARLDLHLPGAFGGPAPWTAIVVVLAVGAAAVALLRHFPSAGGREAAGRALIALGPGALALGATTGLLETRPTLLVAVAAWTGALAVTAGMTVTVRHHDAPLLACLLYAGYLLVVAVRLAAGSHLLAAVLATVVALAAGAAYARAERPLLGGGLLPVLGASVVLAAAYAAAHWPYLAGGRADASGLCVAGVAAAALVVAARVGRGAPSRRAVEVTGLLAGLAAAALPTDATTIAMVLTVVGSAVAISSVLDVGHDQTAWIGLVLLGAATVIRVAEDVRVPEIYTLPAALLLLAAGWWRLQHDPTVASARALSSGLALALLPSLLLALDEPVSLRGALVAAGAALALTVGLVRLWGAPFAAGAATIGVLAIRHLSPVVDAVPRWISLGSVGLALLLVGVTWEQRRRDVTAAGRYLASLR